MKILHNQEQFFDYKYYINDGKKIPHGEYKQYYVDINRKATNLKVHCFYRHGEFHGEYKRYHYNGKLANHFFYISNIHLSAPSSQIGESLEYDENGTLLYREFYLNYDQFKRDFLFIPNINFNKSRFQTLEF